MPAIAVVALATLAATAPATATAGATTTPAEQARRCNGHVEYCARRLDQVAFPTTHNSTAARDSHVLFPNQRHTLARQLRDGIRGFQVDAFLGTVRKVRGRRFVFTDVTPRVQSTLEADLGPDAVRTASRIRKQLGRPAPNAHYGVYLCHNWCELGAVKMLDEARTLARFLKSHRNEVVLWIVQDELPAERLRPVLREAGLDRMLATLDPAHPLPTLGQMIDSGRRLVVGLEHGDLGPEIPNVFDRGLVQEVPYRYETVAELRAPGSCRQLRGKPDAPLFQLNHWITPASRRASAEVNARSFLGRRARECERTRGRVPNLVAVDFYETGNLFDVVDAVDARR